MIKLLISLLLVVVAESTKDTFNVHLELSCQLNPPVEGFQISYLLLEEDNIYDDESEERVGSCSATRCNADHAFILYGDGMLDYSYEIKVLIKHNCVYKYYEGKIVGREWSTMTKPMISYDVDKNHSIRYKVDLASNSFYQLKSLVAGETENYRNMTNRVRY